MANDKPVPALGNLRPWVKGQTGNPLGGPKLPAELREARRKHMANLIKLIHIYVGLTEEEAKERLAGPGALQIEQMIQGQISKASEGDSRAFQFIMEVMCGKVPETDDHTSLADTLTAKEKLAALKKMTDTLELEVANESRPTE